LCLNDVGEDMYKHLRGATHGFSGHNCVTCMEEFETVRILSSIRDLKQKSREAREQLKSCKAREVPVPAYVATELLVDIYWQ